MAVLRHIPLVGIINILNELVPLSSTLNEDKNYHISIVLHNAYYSIR